MEFILASGNAHKAEEFAELFDPSIVCVKAAPEKLEVPETGSTYSENAFQKAEAYYKRFKTPVISDDSGLNVEALPTELGVFSARFGGDGLTDQGRAELLLKKLEGIENRKAYFSCVLCCYIAPNEVFFFEGRLEGVIGQELRGSEGFGYDPVFLPDNYEDSSTLAMIPKWKKENSHRAIASKFAQKFFSNKNES